MAVKTKISKAAFVFSPFSSSEMTTIGQAVRDAIVERISRGEDVSDGPAKPLKPGRIVNGRQLPGYADQKQKLGLPGIRNLMLKGALKTFVVKSASENRVVIGFVDDRAEQIAEANNRRDTQFGVSPNDTLAMEAAVRQVLEQHLVDIVKKA